MEWIKPDKDNLPKGEVLTRNFKEKTYGYGEYLIGFLDFNTDQNYFECENDYQLLNNVTDYCLLEKPSK